VDLFVEGDAWVGAEEHEGPPGGAVFAGQDVIELVACGGGADIQEALEVDASFAFQFEFEVVGEPASPVVLARAWAMPARIERSSLES